MSTPAHQELLATGDFMQSGTSQFIVYSMCLLAVVWAAIQTMLIHRMNMDPHRVKIASDFDQISEEDTSNPKNADTPQTPVQCFKMMRHIAELVQSGAITFLKKEYIYLEIFCVIFAVILYLSAEVTSYPYTTIAFLIGAQTSMLCGYLGMRIAVHTNWRTTYACNISIEEGFHTAFRGG